MIRYENLEQAYDRNFYIDEHFIESKEGSSYSITKFDKNLSINNNKNTLTFINKNNKVFINIFPEFFHYIAESLANIMLEFKIDKSVHFIVNISRLQDYYDKNNKEDYLIALKKLLNKINANYTIVNLNDNNIIINNFFYQSPFVLRETPILNLVEELLEIYDVDTSIKPENKVFINRTKNMQVYQDGRTDIRISNQNEMINFLQNFNFISVKAEVFSFEDKLKFFNNTKIISGNTGSGLMNSIFMQKNQKMIEFTSMLVTDNFESLHGHYQGLAFIKNHLYLSIPHSGDALQIIKTIKNNKFILDLLNE